MFGYADRVAPADRWAVVAYLRALQASASTPAAKLDPADLAALSSATQTKKAGG
jgi:mono/diheme cytochrome c family protein